MSQWPMHPGSLSGSDPASPSQRTSLLSDDARSDDGPRRIPRGPGHKFRHDRERAHASASARDLLHLLINEEHESKQMRKLLYAAFDRLEHETKRAENAEATRDETIQRARAINDARAAAQEQALRAQEELKLYKLQLDNAQKEILRAQEILGAIEAQRDEAEAAAVSARSKARRLNEERLIELAREEGRRLGFEEGVRRGRRMGYREAAYAVEAEDHREEVRDVAATVVDRLLEARERDHPDEPTPIPPPVSDRSAPDVVRVPTPERSPRTRHDSTSGRSTPRAVYEPEIVPPPGIVGPPIVPPMAGSAPSAGSQTPRARSGPLPWPRPPSELPFGRPTSAQNSPPGVRRPDIHVPPDGYIPTADAHHNIVLPPPHELQRNVPSPTPSQRTLGPSLERRRSRDYYDHHPPPRRGSDDDSLASGIQSAASTISQLDIVGLPSGSRQPQSLSVIHEDASMRSERTTDYSQTIASQTGRQSFREMRSSDTLRQDRDAKQHLADELRYSDPSAAEQWRRQYESSRSQLARDAPPRSRPSHVTVPTPLSPPRVLQPHRRSTSERQGRPETRSDSRDGRRGRSSDSSVPEINVEPPSGPPSDAPSRGRGHDGPPMSGLLSPDHAHHALPLPSAPVAPPVQGPAQAAPGPYAGGPPDAQLLPSPWEGTRGLPDATTPRYAVPPKTSSERERERERERDPGRSRTPISFYAASPVPTGVTYPAPPISRSATFSGATTSSAGSNPAESRRRRESVSGTAGRTPAARTRPIPSVGSAEGSVRGQQQQQQHRVPRQPSTASLASSGGYARYDPGVYNDPAYLASSDELEGARPVRVERGGSAGYMYAGSRE